MKENWGIRKEKQDETKFKESIKQKSKGNNKICRVRNKVIQK